MHTTTLRFREGHIIKLLATLLLSKSVPGKTPGRQQGNSEPKQKVMVTTAKEEEIKSDCGEEWRLPATTSND